MTAYLVADIMTHHIDQAGPDQAVGDVAAMMARARISSVIVVDGDEMVGIVTETDMLQAMRTHCRADARVEAVMSRPVLAVPPSMNLHEAYQLAARNGVRHLAVIDKAGKPIGVVTETDFRYHLQLLLVAGRENVTAAMDIPLWTLPPTAGLDEALEVMESRRATCIVVADGRSPLGILTQRDVVRLFAAGRQQPPPALGEVMSQPVVSVRADQPLSWAADLMLEKRIRHLVVVDEENHVLGLLTEHALMRPLELGIIDQLTKERRSNEDQLRLAASVFEQALEGIIITDPAGHIIEVNRSFTELTGYRREEALGRNPSLLKSGRQNPDYYARMWQSLIADGRWRGEVWNRKKNGEVYAELLTISSVYNDAGELTHYVGVFSDITQLKENQRRLERMAHYDALTQLPNRVLFADRLQLALAQAQRSGRMLAVAYLDLDGFKPINDSLGHEAGDQLLIEIAQRLRNCMRSGDTVSRLGGDEFALLLAGIDSIEECERALVRVLAAVAAPITLKGQVVGVSASIGVTLFPNDGASADTLLRHADQSMYLAKEAGRNRYHLYDAEHDRRARAHREALETIETALANNEFRLHYQPKVDLRQGRVVGAEALIRWQHAERGLLLPADFLPVIEDTDFAVVLGRWVIDEALRQMAAWSAQGLDIKVSVNVSARQLQSNDFVADLSGRLAAQPDIAPRQLELEIVETAALEDINRVNAIIAECHNLGVSFALDDFGTGYSSLTYFKRLPAGILKIDQSFVRDMLEDPEDLAIVEGVIGLTQAFHRQVIAEGVETPQHGILLLQLGCNLAQGFGIARPMPGHDFPAWVRRYRPDPQWNNAIRLAREDFPLLAVEVDHNGWIDRLAEAIRAEPGERTPPPPVGHRECRFGRWYASAGWSRYGELDSFRDLAPLHEQVHRVGRDLMGLYDDGCVHEARQRLPELFAIRDRLLDQLRQLQIDASLASAARH